MSKHYTSQEHHDHLFTWIGGCIGAFALFIVCLKIWHWIDKKKLCCKKVSVVTVPSIDNELSVHYRMGAVHIDMGDLPPHIHMARMVQSRSLIEPSAIESFDEIPVGTHRAIREWDGQESHQEREVDREEYLDYLDRRPIALETIDESPEYDIHE